MSNLFDKSNAELRALKSQSESILITPDDMLETFSQIGVKDPDLARVTLQTCVAALMNVQSVLAVDAELKHRASLN